MTTPSFPALLTLIEERSAALRKAVAGADLTSRVPGCPRWAVHDLVVHLGEVQRFWAATVAAGPGDKPPSDGTVEGAGPQGDLLAWSAESTAILVAALAGAGAGHECWTWWGTSSAPRTAGAVARHQVQEAAVHAWDAQEAAGRTEPLPSAVAVDAVDEFLSVSLGSSGPWPHEATRMALHADEGASWLLELTGAGASIAPGVTLGVSPSVSPGESAVGAPEPAARVHGPASDLVLALYGRRPLEVLRVDGDRAVVERLLAWPPLG